MDGKKIEFGENERLLTLQQVVLAAERAKVPLRIDRPGFTRIAVDLQAQLRRPFAAVKPGLALSLGIASITF